MNAGHLPGIYIRPGESAQPLRVEGDLLGIFDEPRFGVMELSCKPGDRLLMFTDGLLEKPDNSGWEEGFEKLRQVVEDLRSCPLDSFVARIHDQMDNGFRADDTLILALEI